MRSVCLLTFCALLLACNQDTNKTREEAAKAAAQLKQESKEAAKELKQDAQEARKQGTAISEGVREGWNADGKTLDLNSASKEQLTSLPGVDAATADHILEHRPYRSKEELVSKHVISDEEYQKIQDKVGAR
jgi:DNA uptake protein ComE-like DNA-binding protein